MPRSAAVTRHHTAWVHEGECYIGVNLDTGAIPDTNAMLTCLGDGFHEVIDTPARHPSVGYVQCRGLAGSTTPPRPAREGE